MKFVLLIGRILFSWIFLNTIIGHFAPGTIAYASSAGVPYASFLVPFSGVLSFLGALSIVLGYKAKIGAWLIVLFLVPVTLVMHNFWSITDPMAHQMQMVMFMKNLSMLGGALMIAYWGSGPLSLDNKVKGKE
ncbi:MAG TPA: DoxX family protein [Flavobacterium sp.]|uniref:DoxX family protein n=1 Tax=Flavobacterium sp. TaxID=239 RepID=UPI002C672A39|nr:DoxX family protein [Flavobacterium sp.]HSD15015.1 DoxX family protein [Flavobacterium sp.]